MNPGTVTLVIYLAGMGLPSWNFDYPLGGLFEAYPKMTLVHTRAPVRHPLVIEMRSKEACLQVAEREKARGNRAWCQTPGAYFLRAEDSGELQLATQLYLIALDMRTCTRGNPRGESLYPHIGGNATTAGDCKTFTRRQTEWPRDRHTSVCIRAPVWIVDRKHWRLIGNQLVYKTSAKAP